MEYDSRLKYRYSISSEEGRTIFLQFRNYSRRLGSDLNSSEYSAIYNEYIGLPKHHVVQFRLSGAVADGDKTLQQAFQMGGVPSDLNSYPLRGYPARSETGKYVVTGTFEYRAPFWFLHRGLSTFPFFGEKLHGAFFFDAGEVWDDRNRFSAREIKVGAGSELRMDITLGYWLKITPALGIAQGLSRGGETQVYFTVYADL
jgi:outer membrane protein assembly factor BamA